MKLREFFKSSDQFPNNQLHVLAENEVVIEHNQMMLDITESRLITVPAIDIISKDCNTNIESLQKKIKWNSESWKFIKTYSGSTGNADQKHWYWW